MGVFFIIIYFIFFYATVGFSFTDSLADTFSDETNSSYTDTYKIVNEKPQISVAGSRFSMYMALWRTLSDSERSIISSHKEAYIISRRDIEWQVSDCDTQNVPAKEKESFWYLDPVRLDKELKLIPSRYAVLTDHLYFVVLNFNSAPLQNLHALQGDSMGSIYVHLDYRLFYGPSDEVKKDFVNFSQYYSASSDLFKTMNKYNPMNWPVYYDERAHKPHTLHQPSNWNDLKKLIQKDQHEFLFQWNTCGEIPEFFMLVDKEKLPKPGPTRPGRKEKGNTPIEIKYIE